MTETCDIAIVGAGAAGLMAAIHAGRAARVRGMRRSIVLLDGAKKIGAKILVSGGGRCNVTHFEVTERAFAGSTPAAIRKVLRRFDVTQTVHFFRALRVELKREETGKLFPTTDRAQTVLDALLVAAQDAGAELRNPWRVDQVSRDPEQNEFIMGNADGDELRAARLILATGGKSLPKSGSDGAGYEFARSLGHSLTPRIFPALVPLTLADGHYIRHLSGITLPATLSVHRATRKKIFEFTDSTLCTHFGLSGPSTLDISRYFTGARMDDPGADLQINWLPGETFDSLDRALRQAPGRTFFNAFRERLPERMVRAVCAHRGIDAAMTIASLSREERTALAREIVECRPPVTGDRGWSHAEVTAGGVPLAELRLESMESRITPGLFIIGEICDVDGRIGGFNFQWAWASGFVAGVSAAGGQ
jgi:predicted Rossmann fold flavoprotein